MRPDGVQLTALPGGLRVVTESMPHASSVAIGWWVGVGSRDEPATEAGASHFLEHLLFKGTEHRSARSIAEAVDAVGGEMNAFTSKEHTAYYARLPAEALALGLDLIGDVLTVPAFRAAEIEAERQVILEELHATEDDPDERVQTLCQEALFPGHPLGWEVLGTPATVAALDRDHIRTFFERWYRPANLVVALAGKLDHEAVVEAIAARFDGVGPGAQPTRSSPEAAHSPLAVLRRPTEQAHVALGWRAPSIHDESRYAVAVLNHAFGAGMSSRLFQEIRETRGLAYSVYSYASLYDDAGGLVAYAGTAPGRVGEVRALVAEIADGIRNGGITARKLEIAKGFLEGSLVLGLEDSGSRMARLAGNLLTHGEVIPVEEHLARIDAVDAPAVAEAASRIFGGDVTVAAVGPIDEADL